MLLGMTGPAATAKKPQGRAGAKQQKKLKQFKGRLPNYYRTVVTDEQRQKIYAIQKQYAPEIRKLREQLKTLTDQRNAKIEALLTPEQREQVAALKNAAKEKRRKAKQADL
jgi:Spy/CpxP family protein refolding chaperone